MQRLSLNRSIMVSIPPSAPEKLVRQINDGDESALAALFDRFADHVYAIALSIVRDPSEAEEIVNDVFSTVWMQAGRYDSQRGSVANWMGMMTRSRSLDRLRKLARNRTTSLHPIEEAASYQQDIEGPTDWQVDQPTIRPLINAAFRELSPAQGQTLELALFHELSHREIAQRLDMPLGTVKSHCKRGLARLKLQLTTLRDLLKE
ncbi:MAG: sigma-70 family RNA polymerase sigma factor [Wenzhouxiangella sp.]